MKPKKRIFLYVIIFIIINTLNISVLADSESMAYSMDITIPENQIDPDLTYFDIKVKPGKKQKLDVIVSNMGEENKKVKVTPTNAITNANGIVDYSVQLKDYTFDNTLKIPFTSLVSGEQIAELNPGESKILSFDFTAPKEEFDGIILGGFVAELIDENNEENNSTGVNFVNKFQFVKAAVIRSSDKEIKPNIVINDIRPALHNYRTAVTTNIQNTTPILLGNVKVDAEVKKKGSQKVIKSEVRNNVEFSPNSNFDFPIMWDDERLEPGDYTMDMTVKANEETFTFSEDFTITKAQSNSINKEAIELEKKEINIAVWLVIIFFFILIVSVLIFVLYKQKNKNKELARDIKIKRNESIKKFIKDNKKDNK